MITSSSSSSSSSSTRTTSCSAISILAKFYPFSQFCEIDVSLLRLHKQPNTAPNLFQRGVEYGKYDKQGSRTESVGQVDAHDSTAKKYDLYN